MANPLKSLNTAWHLIKDSRMQEERLPDQALNEMFGWEHLLVSLWNNTWFHSPIMNRKTTFSKTYRRYFLSYPHFSCSENLVKLLSPNNGSSGSSPSVGHRKLESLFCLKILCYIFCKRHQITCIQIDCISYVSFLWKKTLAKINRQAEHWFLF